MLIFEAWDTIAMIIEHSIDDQYNIVAHSVGEVDRLSNKLVADQMLEASKITNGLMEMFLMKLDDMEDGKMTITRDEIWEAIGYEK